MATKATARKRTTASQSKNNGVFEEIARLVEATKAGKLNTRANVDQFDGQDRVMLQGVNELIEAFVQPINVTAECVDSISKGNIPAKITDTYQGDFNEIKNTLNACIDVMNGLLAETGRVSVRVAGKPTGEIRAAGGLHHAWLSARHIHRHRTKARLYVKGLGLLLLCAVSVTIMSFI